MNQPKPTCSVCIANYNGESYITDCLESVYSQDFIQPIEILVHDDASTDNSVQLIQENFPDVVLIPSHENVGFCISNNRMVAQAQGELILLLNNDAKLRQGALRRLYEAYKTHGDGIYGLPQFNMQTGELIDLGSLFDFFLNPIPNLDPALEDVGMIIGACLFLPRRLWDEIGGFPDFFNFLAEDMYLCCVARLLGYPVKVIKEGGFDHWVGRNIGGGKVKRDNKLSTTVSRRKLSERNKTFVMIMTFPVFCATIVLPLHLLTLNLEGLIISIIKKDCSLFTEIYWNNLLQIYHHRKRLLDERRRIQQAKNISSFSFFTPFQLTPHKIRMFFRHGIPDLK